MGVPFSYEETPIDGSRRPPMIQHFLNTYRCDIRTSFIIVNMAFGIWSPVASTSTSTPTAKPRFSSYLLPTFKLPFRRRPPTNTSLNSDLPSLSSSPTSSVTSSPASSPRSSLPTYLDAVSDDKCRPAPAPVPTRRLSRAAPDTLRCSSCSCDIAFHAQIMSKGFTGRHGRAYLVSPSPPASVPSRFSLSDHDSNSGAADGRELLNIRINMPETRQLVTGWHTVADITCAGCGLRLGWKYVDARDPPQFYKIGKFILETQRVSAFRSWEDVDADVDADDNDGAYGYDWHANHSGETGAQDDIVFDSDDEDECEDIFAGVWDPVTVAQRRSRKGNASFRPLKVNRCSAILQLASPAILLIFMTALVFGWVRIYPLWVVWDGNTYTTRQNATH
ncbi:hypothetical protein ACRALDRAFT_207164 [Sodiomyces alcalophilus JCM 7366]|uniref:uncharacterized protein n=1 Tax=Sodiomyces alcalophilus JCM 7366 TaxID=591952 RepID=UPI0039B501E2